MKTNRRLTVLAVATVAVSIAAAMPSKSEFAKAQPIVNELMNPFINGYKAKKNTAAEVGAKAVEYSREAETEAAKFLLLKGAITYYSMAEDYDKAADAVDELASVVKDIPPDRMLDIISRATSRISEANAPRLHAQYRLTSARVRADKEIGRLKALLAKRPSDAAARRRYAEMLAVSGDWKAALEEFSKLGGKVAEVASAEKSGKGKSGVIAEFWWDYEPEEQYASDAMKSHAAEFYRKALADGSLSGLKRTVAERRLATMPAAAPSASTPAKSPSAPTPVAATPAAAPVVEPPASRIEKPAPVAVKGGPWTLPKTFATPLERSLDLGGGVQMPFCAIPAGSFRMMDHKVTITRPYWISKTAVSLNQLLSLPAGQEVRIHYPYGQANVDKFKNQFNSRFSTMSVPISFAHKYAKELTRKYRSVLPPGYVFRLPTEAEFHYAYCAGVDEMDVVLNSGFDDVDTTTGEALSELGWIPKVDMWDWKSRPGYGGLKLATLPDANAFGVVRWVVSSTFFFVLDTAMIKGPSPDIVYDRRIKEIMQYADEEIDPLRTGNHYIEASGRKDHCLRFVKGGHPADFMIVIGPDLESEKKAAGK